MPLLLLCSTHHLLKQSTNALHLFLQLSDDVSVCVVYF